MNDNDQLKSRNNTKPAVKSNLERQAFDHQLALLKRRKRRHLRTVFLAIVAAITFVWAAISVWDVEPEEMLEFFTMSLLLVVILMLLAALLVGIKSVFRRFFN
ncbi:hypothetical protein [Sinobacterium caligoides]|nr:hypothetical protein [Sinobacterium caligoides]